MNKESINICNKINQIELSIKKYENIRVYLTGYGPFMNVINNPSEILINHIYLNKQLISFKLNNKVSFECFNIMDVNCKFVSNNLPYIWNKVKGNTNSKEMKLIIHFGVNENILNPILNLETSAKNYINEYTETGLKGKIVENLPEDYILKTKLNIVEIKRRMKDYSINSDDAGNYLCNYVYFNSLINLDNIKDSYCQFIHIPSLKVLNIQTIMDFFVIYLESLISIYCI